MERWTAGVSQWFRPKLQFLNQNLFPMLKLISIKLLKSSYLILELLTDLITPILECADMRVPNLVFLSVFYDCYVEVRRVLG